MPDSTSRGTVEQYRVPVLVQARGALGPAAPWGNTPHTTPGPCKKAFAIRICGLKETHLQQDGGWRSSYKGSPVHPSRGCPRSWGKMQALATRAALYTAVHPFPMGTKATGVTWKTHHQPRHWKTPAWHAAAPERPQLQAALGKGKADPRPQDASSKRSLSTASLATP